MKDNKFIYLFVVLTIAISCKKNNQEKDSENRISHRLFELEGKGWKSQRIIHFVNNIHYRATEVPNEYYLLKNEGKAKLSQIDSLAKEFRNERIIEFEFEQLNEDDLLKEEYTNMDYDNSVNYMGSKISKDFFVVTSRNDTVHCSGVQFERHFNVSPFKRILLYFGNIDPSETIQLIYQDHLFGNGLFKFKFNELPFKT